MGPHGELPALCYGRLVYEGPVNITDLDGNVVATSS